MATLIKGRRVVTENRHSPKDKVVRLEPGDDPASVALEGVARVEVNFPKFGDGRGYSIARLLRERRGYRGELRAVGHITRDLLFFLESCGFDAFELREGEDPHAALASFDDFSHQYQRGYGNRGQNLEIGVRARFPKAEAEYRKSGSDPDFENRALTPIS